jgi:hypothetical protein
MQMFVKCPLCGEIYDALEKPSLKVSIDGVQRTAHIACVEQRLPLPMPAGGKPNGEAKGNGMERQGPPG